MDKRLLYEKKVINDEEYPLQFIVNAITTQGEYFYMHWHEHIELHYIVEGSSILYCNQKKILAKKGSLVVINSNELHRGVLEEKKMEAIVIIFELSSFSKEVAYSGFVFQNLIENDSFIQNKMEEIYTENNDKNVGYKLAVRGMLYEMITYLMRNHVSQKLSESENTKRNKKLIRLNTVIEYIQQNYNEPISNKTLASMIHISEDRFNHLFKESMGISPLNYINEMRLEKARNLLQTGEYTISEAAMEVGFSDINHFGRLFRKKYECTPSKTAGRK